MSIRATLIGICALLGLAACEPQQIQPDPAPPPKVEPSDQSKRVAAYYAATQARMLASGHLRTERNPSDAAFSPSDLARNFTDIALHDEYVLKNGRFIQQKTPSRLRRWIDPVRVKITFGPSVTPEQRIQDTKNVAEFTQRLRRLTKHNIRLVTSGPSNFDIMFLNRDEQKNISSFKSTVPTLIPAVVSEIEQTPRNIFCVAYALADSKRELSYKAAVILVKSEHQPLMRKSCVHEEMAQAMGLANDSPEARPSIFNDDEEFALLTHHDELLLQILYDPRMKLGMTPQSAQPVLKDVIASLLGGAV